jgi:hypothetical protein
MQLRNYNRIIVGIRSILIIVILLFCIILSNAQIADADVYVSGNFYYISGMFVIGSAAIYFIFSSGNRGHYSKQLKPRENNIIASAYDTGLEMEDNYSCPGNPPYKGLFTIYTW